MAESKHYVELSDDQLRAIDTACMKIRTRIAKREAGDD